MTRIVQGYVRGVPFDTVVVEREGKLLEAATALAWDLMKDAAKLDGVDLDLNSGWRSNEEQTAIWTARQDPAVRAIKGVAARPGWSNHQSGTALDIRTGMSLADLTKGRKTREFRWLEMNALRFGFARTVRSEPWHWERVAIAEDRG